MLMNHKPFEQLGRADFGWLKANHHFSFGHYYDPRHMGIGKLRVWNDDLIKAKKGFDPHPHRDMEIITYVRKGAITHEDSLGNSGRTEAGDIQVMWAGTGIVHSEYNLEDEDTLLFQIWIETRTKGRAPGWDAKEFPKSGSNGLRLMASGLTNQDDVIHFDADAHLFAGRLKAGSSHEHQISISNGQVYLVPAEGKIMIDGQIVSARDGLHIAATDHFVLEAIEDSEIVMVEVAS